MRLNDGGRALLFTEARTANTFSDRPVTGERLREIYELMKWGPTWSNTLPLRIATPARAPGTNAYVDLAYTTFTGGKIVIATDDVGSARSVLRA
jgi:hypothetical protein